MANEIKYKPQVFPEDHPVEGERLSTNGFYTGEKKGMPMQDYADPEENGQNEDAYWVENNTVRLGTLLQDATEGSMPEVDDGDDDDDSEEESDGE